MDDHRHGSRSYPVMIEKPDGSHARGGLFIEPDVLLFRGTDDEGLHVVQRLRYADLVGVRIDRDSPVRSIGRPALALKRVGGAPWRIGVIGAGLLRELADLLAFLADDERRERVVVVAHIREGMGDRVRALIADGPPFDLEASGLVHHQVLLTDDSAVFVFEGQITEVMKRLIQEPELWREALRWEACLGGRPQLAEPAFSWTLDETSIADIRPRRTVDPD
jgi:hypothetical protein